MKRHKITEVENPYIARIRDGELANPAPFSNNELLILDDKRTLAEHPELAPPKVSYEIICNVPVIDIVGVAATTHLDGFESGMTFREVLFRCLHAASLNEQSLGYFLSDCLKSHRHNTSPGYSSFPQDDSLKGTSAYGRGGIILIKRANRYFVEQGQQRTLMAMFWIYQNYGHGGALKNVLVSTPLIESTPPPA